MPKKKINRLSYKEKYEILGQVKAGSSKQHILQKYGICDRTYKRVLTRQDDVNNKVNNYEYRNKKTSKTSDNMSLDAAVIEWFRSARDRGDPISGPIVQEKARIMNENLNGPKTFKASNGWFERFKKRYGIRSIRMKGEKLPSDPLGAAEFSPILEAKIESNLIHEDWKSFSDRDIANFETNCKREPEIVTKIEKSESLCEYPELMEVTTSEAFDSFMKFKSWLKSRAECLPKHLDYITELEKLLTE